MMPGFLAPFARKTGEMAGEWAVAPVARPTPLADNLHNAYASLPGA
jgi:hypothetical protein